MIAAIQELLAPRLAPRYAVLIEEGAYLLWEEVPLRVLGPDVAVVGVHEEAPRAVVSSSVATLEPSVRTQVVPAERTDRWLEIRTPDGREVVTVIEIQRSFPSAAVPGDLQG